VAERLAKNGECNKTVQKTVQKDNNIQHPQAQQSSEDSGGVLSIGDGVVDVFKNIDTSKRQNNTPSSLDPAEKLIEMGVSRNIANQLSAEYDLDRISGVIAWATNPVNDRENVPGTIVQALIEGWTVTNKKKNDGVQSHYSPNDKKKASAANAAFRLALANPKPPEEIAESQKLRSEKG
jgi:hypothetical protein